MLKIENEEHMRNVEAFADKQGMRDRLDEKLSYLGEYAGGVNTRCTLFKDFAPASFEFVMENRKCEHSPWKFWFNGGLIFYSAGDTGVDKQFSVRLDDRDAGWSIHT